MTERADRLATERLVLEPLRTAHAAEMVALLDDPELHRYVGGSPLRLHELERRYEHQVRGSSADGTARWFNWIVCDRTSGEAVGYVQATVEVASAVADVAWVIGSRFQRRGYAQEAAAAMTAWLRGQGVTALSAHIHPQNEASRAVARSIGLAPTATSVDGEVRWENEAEAASGDDLRRDPVQPRRRPSA